jgi:hypothetical protein
LLGRKKGFMKKLRLLVIAIFLVCAVISLAYFFIDHSFAELAAGGSGLIVSAVLIVSSVRGK